ncbi:MAG: DNA mismatch repair endonuclease MutL [Candidatus Thorarchaeota archaeon]|nr:DNA mismatch repair endonuclease MutL [Candidatus Thorarchaeota archaeon]
MGKVRMLTEDLVSLISAGEVIENPSSIVKELMENSLDAGANLIDISIEEGGTKSIVVSDNGTGILREDCAICLHRYSTSKISTREDIEHIATYGFRGEALASIAAVGDIRITTQTESEEIGTVVTSRFGQKTTIRDQARPVGTTVEVTDLFRDIPARRKHLADEKTEAQRIQEAVMRHAVIRPEIGFRLRRNNELVIDCPPKQSATDRITALWGIDVAKALVDVDYKTDEIRISGFIARPPISRGNRSREYFSVVKRPISDERLSQSVEIAFSTTLMKGQFPICALDVSLDLSKVDVNVHPTKREVRILNIEKVCEAVSRAVRYALGEREEKTEATTLESILGLPTQENNEKESHGTAPILQEEQIAAIPLVEQVILKPPDIENEESIGVEILGGVFRIVGQIHKLYILLESDEGLLIVDQHAAHERVLYEQLRKEVNTGTVAVQELLQPFILSLSPKDAEQILDLAETLDNIGFSITSFGGNEISISAVPEIFGRVASEIELISLVDRIVDIGEKEAVDAFMDNVIKVAACHSAIRSGQSLSNEEIRDLIEELSRTKSKYNCCHGRPSMIRILKEDIDRKVGRMGPEAIARFKARHRLD